MDQEAPTLQVLFALRSLSGGRGGLRRDAKSSATLRLPGWLLQQPSSAAAMPAGLQGVEQALQELRTQVDAHSAVSNSGFSTDRALFSLNNEGPALHKPLCSLLFPQPGCALRGRLS